MRAACAFGILLGAAFLIAGCASEGERYAWSVTHVRVCKNARQITHAQLADIIRVVVRATRQNPVAVSTLPPDYSLTRLDVTTAYPAALEVSNPDRKLFGFCTLERTADTWRVTEVHTSLDPMLAYGACWDTR